MNHLKEIYHRRFAEDSKFRNKMWEVLCADFFQNYIPENSVVLDVGAGYCEFINNIRVMRKIALDLNPDVKKFAGSEVEVVLSSSTYMKQINDETVDVAFISNFFEHLSKEEIVRSLKEIHRVLKKYGKFLILQPNIRYCAKDYWMFFDHITPLDDRSLSEALETHGFKVVECKPKFLPFTMKSNLPRSIFLLRLYLKLPFVQRIFGKQAFIYAKKI